MLSAALLACGGSSPETTTPDNPIAPVAPVVSGSVTLTVTPTQHVAGETVVFTASFNLTVDGAEQTPDQTAIFYVSAGNDTTFVVQNGGAVRSLERQVTNVPVGGYKAVASMEKTIAGEKKKFFSSQRNFQVAVADTTPPGSIDATIERTNKYGTLKIKATASGDDGNQGTLSKLEVYILNNDSSRDKLFTRNNLAPGTIVEENINFIPLGLKPGEEAKVEAYGTDDAGNTSQQANTATGIIPGYSRTIQLYGINAKPTGPTLIPINNGFAQMENITTNEVKTYETDTNGLITIQDIEKGTYKTSLRDELGAEIGDWLDFNDRTEQTINANNTNIEKKYLIPNVTIEGGFYNNILEFLTDVNPELLTEFNKYPITTYINADSARADLKDAQIAAVQKSMENWNAQGYNNFTEVNNPNQAELEVLFDPTPGVGTFYGPTTKQIFIETNFPPHKLESLENHEFSHASGMNRLEAKGNYASTPTQVGSITPPPNGTDLGALEIIKNISKNKLNITLDNYTNN